MVGFCDFVGVDIAPVSKKTAVKSCYPKITFSLYVEKLMMLINASFEDGSISKYLLKSSHLHMKSWFKCDLVAESLSFWFHPPQWGNLKIVMCQSFLRVEKLSKIKPPVLSIFFSDKNCTAHNPALLSLMPDTNLISQTEIDQHLARLYCLKTCELLEYYPEYVEFSFFYLQK